MTEHRCFKKINIKTVRVISKYWISLYKLSSLSKRSVKCKTPVGATRCPPATPSLHPHCGRVRGVARRRRQNITSATNSDGSPNHLQPISRSHWSTVRTQRPGRGIPPILLTLCGENLFFFFHSAHWLNTKKNKHVWSALDYVLTLFRLPPIMPRQGWRHTPSSEISGNAEQPKSC